MQAFELATGDYLFEPHSGEDYTRDEGQCSIFPCFFVFIFFLLLFNGESFWIGTNVLCTFFFYFLFVCS